MPTTGKRTTLLVRCTQGEAQLIRIAAKREHRNISGYILHVVLARIAHRDEVLKNLPEELKRRFSEE